MEQPLLEYFINAFQMSNGSLGEYEQSSLRSILSQYINNSMSEAQCKISLQQICPDISPLSRLTTILSLGDDPLPSDGREVMIVGVRKRTRPWTESEDNRLLLGIHRFGLDHWAEVAQFVGNSRLRSQCSQRWLRVLHPHISKDHWTPEEDNRLIELVQKHGTKSWIKVSDELGHRSDVQCRYHYKQMRRIAGDPLKPPKKRTTAASFLSMYNPFMYQKLAQMSMPPQLHHQMTQMAAAAAAAASTEPPKQMDAPITLREQANMNGSTDLFKSDAIFDSFTYPSMNN